MNKEEFAEKHIVVSDDVITDTSPVYHTLKLVDKCTEYLNNTIKSITELKNKAIEDATNNNLTLKQWGERFIDPLEDLIENISSDLDDIADDYFEETYNSGKVIYE